MKELFRNRLTPLIWWGLWLLVWTAFVSVPTRVVGFRDWRLIGIGTISLVAAILASRWAPLGRLAPRLALALDRRHRRLVLLAAVTGLALRVAYALAVPVEPVSDAQEYWGLATRLAGTGEYSSLVPTPGEPSSFTKWHAYRAPGYPIFLAACFRLFGHSMAVPVAANLFLFVLTLWTLRGLVSTISGRGAAVFAAWMLALWPGQIAFTPLLAYEPLFTFLVLASLRQVISSRHGGLGPMAVAGLLTGMAALVRPTALVLPALWFVYHLITDPPRTALRTAIIRSAAAVAVLMAVVLPWTWRNHNHGMPVLVSGNGPTALYLVANPGATVDYNEDIPDALKREVHFNEHAYYTESGRRAAEWIRNNPGSYLAMAAGRQVVLLGDDGDGWFWSLKTGAGLGGHPVYFVAQAIGHVWWVGLWCLVTMGLVRGKALFFSTPAVQFLVLAVLIVWTSGMPFCQAARYHMPIAPLLMVVGSLALSPVAKLVVAERRRRGPVQRAEPLGEVG